MTTVLQFPIRQQPATQRPRGETMDPRIDAILRTRVTKRTPRVGKPGYGAERSKAIRDVFRALGWSKYFRVTKGCWSLGPSIEWAKGFTPRWYCQRAIDEHAAAEKAGRYTPLRGHCGTCDTCRYRDAQRDAVRRRVHYALNVAFADGTREFGDRSDTMTDYFDSDYTFHP